MDIHLPRTFDPATRPPAPLADLARVLAALALFAGLGLAAAHVPGWSGAPGAGIWHGNAALSAPQP
ncbi:hypothetical protein PVT71_16825 [Salipiger sp. H15]|uniref:Uncharacterized protein n=1 Tax=Alloyangia sp. H15 TaxID=3029062 RepID=A0AAU8AN19_9RHOB